MPICQDDADGGVIAITTDGGSSDHYQAQLNGESFYLTEGRRMFFEARWKVLTTGGDVIIGIASNADTTNGAHVNMPDDCIVFGLDGDLNLMINMSLNDSSAGAFGAADTDTNTDLTADTFVVTRWEYNGSDKVRFYVDGVLTNTLTANIPKDQYMSPIFLLDNSGAAAETLSIDYILCVNERG